MIVRGLPPRPASAQSNHKPPSQQSNNFPPRAASVQAHHDPPPEHIIPPPAKRTYLNPDDRPLKPPPTTASASRKENAHSHTRTLRPSPQPTAADQAMEEDVRMMNSEAEDLRERSRSSAAHLSSPGGVQPEFSFPPPSAKSASKLRSRNASQPDRPSPTTPSSSSYALQNGVTTSTIRKMPDTMQPIAEQETPQIAKNRVMRGQLPSAARKAPPENLSVAGGRRPSAEPGPSNPNASDNINGHASSSTPGRRRSSMGMRGKRVSASFDASGVLGT